ncbi:unnamed protein product, partial [Prorocentrum cordatum]
PAARRARGGGRCRGLACASWGPAPPQPGRPPVRGAVAAACAMLGGAWSCCRSPLAMAYTPGARNTLKPPGPLALRERTTQLKDPVTGLPRAAPKEADIVLDFFQRTFPGVTTEEAQLIKRWENLGNIFGGHASANELVLDNPMVIRKHSNSVTNSWLQLERYFGPGMARKMIFAQPYLLTRSGRIMKESLPAHLNLFGSKERVAEISSCLRTRGYRRWPSQVSTRGWRT